MKLLLIVLGIVASVSLAQAQSGGTPTNPLYVREHQGTTRTYAEVACTTTGDIVLIAATSTVNARSILLTNEDPTNFVTICPTAGIAGACDAAAEGFTLWPKGTLPIDRSIRDTAWSCDGDTGTVIVGILIEK